MQLPPQKSLCLFTRIVHWNKLILKGLIPWNFVKLFPGQWFTLVVLRASRWTDSLLSCTDLNLIFSDEFVHDVWSTGDKACIVECKHYFNELTHETHGAAYTHLKHSLDEIINRQTIVLNVLFDSLVEWVVMISQISFHHKLSILSIVLEPRLE